LHLDLNHQYQNHTVWRCNIATSSTYAQCCYLEIRPTRCSHRVIIFPVNLRVHQRPATTRPLLQWPTFMGRLLIPSGAWETLLLRAVGNTCVRYCREGEEEELKRQIGKINTGRKT